MEIVLLYRGSAVLVLVVFYLSPARSVKGMRCQPCQVKRQKR